MDLKKVGIGFTRLITDVLASMCLQPDGTYRGKAVRSALSEFEKRTNGYCSLYKETRFPTSARQVISFRQFNQIAVILQGQVENCLDFLLETIAFYAKAYPGIHIIVSTWVDEDPRALEVLEESPLCTLITSEYPVRGGSLHVNYQVANTFAGVEKAKSLGVRYVCKTRTDQRLQRNDVFGHLKDLVSVFPSSSSLDCRGRIAALGMTYGNLFYPFLLSDFLYFGYTEDIERMFSLPLDSRAEFDVPSGSTRRQWSEAEKAPEVMIAKSYARSLGLSADSTVRAWWEFLKNAIVCTDVQSVGLIWPKYDSRFIYEKSKGLEFDDDTPVLLKTYNTDFKIWLGIYSGGITYREEYERYADVVFK
jgi:hypothetical protein